jgi:hypothetical protein
MLIHEVIGRNDPDWRLKHACPACTYTLAGEVPHQENPLGYIVSYRQMLKYR